MASVTELSFALTSALEAPQPDSEHVGELLERLAALLHQPDDVDSQASAAAELDELLFDLHAALLAAAALSPAADAHVRALLAAAARCCTAREVFTLGMAALSEQLGCQHERGVALPPAHGPASPAFQLFLLRTLCGCLPRIRRRPLHFLAELLHMQLRWAAEALPPLPLGDARSAAAGDDPSRAAAGGDGDRAAASAPTQPPQQVTVATAVAELAALASSMAAWARQAGQQLSAAERQAAMRLLGTALLQLAGIALQLPQVLEAAASAVSAASGVAAATLEAAPVQGGRLPLMRAAADELLLLPRVLLRRVPAEASSATSAAAGGLSPEALQQLGEGVDEQLRSSGLDAEQLAAFSAPEAAEGAAAAACAAALEAPPPAPELQRAHLQTLLPEAARVLLDLGAQHRSAALTLLPLCALCMVGSAAAVAGPAAQLSAGSPALRDLAAGLVAIMSHNPVQLVRSCAHDALQALLGAYQPAARLEQLRALMQMPSTAAAVVALQRLRQEMAAAWGAATPLTGQQEAAVQGQPWLSEAALQLALPCLEHGAEEGWHDEASVLRQADVQAAALSLLRWVLLREAAAPRGVLPAAAARQLLQRDLLPLQACVQRLLQMQARAAGGGSGGGTSGSSGAAAAAALQRAQLEGFLAVQRLHEALGCVTALIPG